MRKLIYSLAMSLDNKIARMDGGVGWLNNIPNPDQSDYGFGSFLDSVSTTIMGYNTYEVVTGFDVEWPYKEKDSYDFTRKKYVPDDPDVTFIRENHTDFVRDLKNHDGGDIWLVGGGVLATYLFNQNLIDRFLLHIMPLILGDGIPFILPKANERIIELVSEKTYRSGVIEVVYDVN
jgi:dihydrofolate reductase